MPDEPIRIRTEVDLSGLKGFSAGAQEASSAAAQLAQKFQQQGLSSKEAAAALVNLGYAEKEAAAAAGLLAEAQGAANSKVIATTAGMSGLERATAMAGARMTGQLIPGFGMAGYQIGRVAAMLPGVGMLFAAALPVSLLVFAVQAIENWRDALEKTRNEMTQLSVTARDQSDALALDNLKLQDEAATLENRPKQNLMKEALIETRLESDKVAESIANDLTKLETLFRAGPGIFSTFFGSADESRIADQLKPLDRAYQMAVLGNNVEAQKNALLQAQAVIQKALTDETAQRVQLQTVAGQQVFSLRSPDTKAVQDYKEALSTINSLLGEQGEQATRSALTQQVAALQQKKDLDDFWSKYSAGFKQSEAELKHFDQAWKEFQAKKAEDARKTQDELARIDEEGQKQLSDLAARASEQLTSQNIENARAAAEQVESSMRQIQQPSFTGVGQFGAMAKFSQAKEDMASIAAEIQKVNAAMAQLRADSAGIQSKPLLSETDQKNVKAYADEIARLQQLLDRLNTEYQRTSVQVGTAGQAMARMTQTAFDSLNEGTLRVLENQESFGRAMQQVWNQAAGAVITALERTLEEMLINIIRQKTLMDSTKYPAAAKAARDTYASVAAIPYVGWILAPEAAAAAFAAVLAFEQGGIVPGGLGQAVPIYAHAQEMVLPAHVTNWVMKAAGGDGGARSSSTNVHLHANVHSIDSAGVKDFFERNAPQMVTAAMRHVRRRAK